MEFATFSHLSTSCVDLAKPGAEQQRLLDNVELAVRSERWGFKYAWASEHHFLDGYSHMADPMVFSAWVGARTKTLHVGSAITNLCRPVNHPVRIAEQVAMLDLLTDGRYEFGTGRGSSSTEALGFGIESLAATRALWSEAIHEIPRMWRDEVYSYEGQSFSVPPRKILPRLALPVAPPMWVAAGNLDTFEMAGRMGLGVMCFALSALGDSGIPHAIERYRKALERAEPVSGWVNDNVAVVVPGFLVEADDAAAVRRFCGSGINRQHTAVVRYLDSIPQPFVAPPWPEQFPAPTPGMITGSRLRGGALVGDPAVVAEVVAKYREYGVDMIVIDSMTGNLPMEDYSRSLQLFGEQVIPQFDRDPLPRTRRLRLAALAASRELTPA
jgi:alkanesulfonate monooxygenase SsuD/methylene tetrahydromethanopterin reductase-like flavin-dependent oxidoreductase (luciferase family)